MLLRSINLILGFSASPLRRWSPRSSISLPKIVPLLDSSITSSPQARPFSESSLPCYSVHVKALQVSSRSSESCPAEDAATFSAVASPIANSVVGCVVEHDGEVLLCKRNIHPSYGLWTVPAGYLEIGESAAEGAKRETFEEANAQVEIISPFAHLDIPHIGQSYIIFRAKMKKPGYFSPGPESLECMLFTLDDIPFGSLAFSSIHFTLKMYVEDIKNENLRFHYCTINKRAGASLSDPNGFYMEHHLHS